MTQDQIKLKTRMTVLADTPTKKTSAPPSRFGLPDASVVDTMVAFAFGYANFSSKINTFIPMKHGLSQKPATEHPAALPADVLLKQCEETRGRKSGPGGQHRNKTETAIQLTHQPTGITAAASERREQAVNRKVALRRLRLQLALSQRGYFDVMNEPTPLWTSRTADGQIHVNPRHPDWPAILAELLDVLEQKNWEPRRAGVLLEVSASQIVKLLKQEPKALAYVNEHRQHKGKRPLR